MVDVGADSPNKKLLMEEEEKDPSVKSMRDILNKQASFRQIDVNQDYRTRSFSTLPPLRNNAAFKKRMSRIHLNHVDDDDKFDAKL